MNEQQFFYRQVPAAAGPPRLTRTGIQITWRMGVVKAINIRHLPVKLIAKIFSLPLQPGDWPAFNAPPSLGAEVRKILASRPGRRVP